MKARSRINKNATKAKLTNLFNYLVVNACLIGAVSISHIYGLHQDARTRALLSPVGELRVQAKTVETWYKEEKMTFDNPIEQEIYDVFGEDYGDAMKILECENRSLDPKAVNHNRNGSIDEGIFQINSVHNQPNMLDYKANIAYAKKIFDRQNWSPWSCSHKVGVTPFYLK